MCPSPRGGSPGPAGSGSQEALAAPLCGGPRPGFAGCGPGLWSALALWLLRSPGTCQTPRLGVPRPRTRAGASPSLPHLLLCIHISPTDGSPRSHAHLSVPCTRDRSTHVSGQDAFPVGIHLGPVLSPPCVHPSTGCEHSPCDGHQQATHLVPPSSLDRAVTWELSEHRVCLCQAPFPLACPPWNTRPQRHKVQRSEAGRHLQWADTEDHGQGVRPQGEGGRRGGGCLHSGRWVK